MITLSVPTNWEEALLDVYTSGQISEVYGKLAEDAVGGGRPAFSVTNVNRKKARKYISSVRERNCRFNYLLNSSCLGGREYTRRGLRDIYELLEWISGAGVDTVTVSIPFLAELIRSNFRDLKINVSVMAQVDSLKKALFWEDLGVSCITLLHTKVTRDFKLIEQIRNRVKCDLALMANNHCIPDCPREAYHGTMSSHASQSGPLQGNFILDYCLMACRLNKIVNPHLFISSSWIRPEDVDIYEKRGIDRIKIVDRRLQSGELKRIIEAYINRKYDGNMLDLFPTLGPASPQQLSNLLLRLKHLKGNITKNVSLLAKLHRILASQDIYIDNRALEGFIDFFLVNDCRSLSCGECRYCHRIAQGAVKVDGEYQKKSAAGYAELINCIISK